MGRLELAFPQLECSALTVTTTLWDTPNFSTYPGARASAVCVIKNVFT